MPAKLLKVADKLTNALMVIFFLLLILIGGYAFVDSYMIYDTTKLSDEILTLKPKLDENYNFQGLQDINPDVEGWITIFDTTIDYPILHSKDNLDYLNMDYNHKFSTGGSIFTDYRNRRNFADDYTIIYGHNMMTGQMFSDVKRYADPEYFQQHLHGALHTVDGIYKLEVLYFAKVNAYEDDAYNLITYINGRNNELASIIQDKAWTSSTTTSELNKLLLLSTCDSYGSNDRMVLLVNAVSSDEDEMKRIEDEYKQRIKEQGDATGGIRAGFYEHLVAIVLILLIIIMLLMVGVKIYRYYKNRKKLLTKKDD